MNTVNEKIDYFNTKIAEYTQIREELGKKLEAEFPDFVRAVLEEKNFPYLVMQGYTMAFNDGDPCTYQTYIDLTFSGDDNIEKIVEQFDDADFSNLDCFNYSGLKSNDALMNSAKSVENVFNNLEEIMEIALGDGWQVIAAFDKNGEFHFHLEDYDCGY